LDEPAWAQAADAISASIVIPLAIRIIANPPVVALTLYRKSGRFQGDKPLGRLALICYVARSATGVENARRVRRNV
jgi:hypothetical protein